MISSYAPSMIPSLLNSRAVPSTWFRNLHNVLVFQEGRCASLLMLNCLPSMLVFFSPVFVLALSGEVLFWIFSFVTNKNQIYSDAESRSGRRSDVLEMKAQLVTHNSADHSQAGLTADATTYRIVDWDSVFFAGLSKLWLVATTAHCFCTALLPIFVWPMRQEWFLHR